MIAGRKPTGCERYDAPRPLDGRGPCGPARTLLTDDRSRDVRGHPRTSGSARSRAPTKTRSRSRDDC